MHEGHGFLVRTVYVRHSLWLWPFLAHFQHASGPTTVMAASIHSLTLRSSLGFAPLSCGPVSTLRTVFAWFLVLLTFVSGRDRSEPAALGSRGSDERSSGRPLPLLLDGLSGPPPFFCSSRPFAGRALLPWPFGLVRVSLLVVLTVAAICPTVEKSGLVRSVSRASFWDLMLFR